MFPMNETVRKNLESQTQLSRKIADQMMDWQSQSAQHVQSQFNASFDAMRSMMDVQQKAARAMQQTMLDAWFPAQTAA